MPANIAEIAKAVLDGGGKQDYDAVNETLALVSSGRLARECGVQEGLVDRLCDYGADPNSALLPALAHGEFAAVDALIRRGARIDLAAAAALGRAEDVARLPAKAPAEDRHRALAVAAQFGHAEIIRLLLDAREDPNRYNLAGTHAHSTPLHQAALAGHFEVVRLLVERGARLDLEDTIWHATPEGWATHGGKAEIAEYLRLRRAQNRA